MARIILILTVAWTLLLLPALCTAGWLLHPCDCGSAIGCEHETDCDSDPCEIRLVRSDAWSQNHLDGAVAASTPVPLDVASRSFDVSRTDRRPHTSSRAFRKVLPLPPTDLPRLI